MVDKHCKRESKGESKIGNKADALKWTLPITFKVRYCHKHIIWQYSQSPNGGCSECVPSLSGVQPSALLLQVDTVFLFFWVNNAYCSNDFMHLLLHSFHGETHIFLIP